MPQTVPILPGAMTIDTCSFRPSIVPILESLCVPAFRGHLEIKSHVLNVVTPIWPNGKFHQIVDPFAQIGASNRFERYMHRIALMAVL